MKRVSVLGIVFCGLWALAGDQESKTEQWIQEVEKKSEVKRFYEVARAYEEGRGVPVDLPSAKHWYTRALREAGRLEARQDIRRLDEKLKIFNSLKEDARSGDAHSQYLLGMHYALGVMGPPQDGDMARYWLERAAGRGYGPAAEAYRAFLEKYPAVKGLVKKARAGDRGSQFNLAYAYEVGMGVGQNLDQALYWYRRASLQGHAGAGQRERLLKHSPYVQAALNQSCLKNFQ